jgi:hypothetical protein
MVALSQVVTPASLNWRVGESADFKLNGGFISGTMHAFVREEVPQGYWVQQDVDLGFAGQRKSEMLYDKNTGEVLEIVVDGEKQDLGNPADRTVISSRQEVISVPKGQFDCVYTKIRDNRKNEETELWMNPTVPVGGMVKTIAPTPIGKMTIELTNFQP